MSSSWQLKFHSWLQHLMCVCRLKSTFHYRPCSSLVEHHVAQRIRHQTTDLETIGSSPIMGMQVQNPVMVNTFSPDPPSAASTTPAAILWTCLYVPWPPPPGLYGHHWVTFFFWPNNGEMLGGWWHQISITSSSSSREACHWKKFMFIAQNILFQKFPYISYKITPKKSIKIHNRLQNMRHC